MATIKLTMASVEAAEKGDRDVVIWDRDLRGFGLKITSSGSKIYIVQYRMGGREASTRRYTIGRHDSPWTPIDARREAERVLMQVRSNSDPQAAKTEKRRQTVDLALDAYIDTYLEAYGRTKWKPRTFLAVSSNLRRYVLRALRGKALPEITRRDITTILDRVPPSSVGLKRTLFAHTRRLFAWAVERGDLKESPCRGMKSPPAVASRERVLSDEEMKAVLCASEFMPHPFGPFVRLLLLTGQRRDEVAGLRWEELNKDLELWTLPKTRTKNSCEHKVPISHPVARELNDLAGGDDWPKRGYVLTTTGKTPISGFSKMKTRLDRFVEGLRDGDALAPWRLHDLRRSMATSFQRLGVRFEVTEAMLNHVSGAKSGVAGIYQRYDWAAEKRDAAELWAMHLRKVLNPAKLKEMERVSSAAALVQPM